MIATVTVSELFDPSAWSVIDGFDFTYHRAVAHGTVRIAFNRPQVRNAFRPSTVARATSTRPGRPADTIDPARAGRLHILECQRPVPLALLTGGFAGCTARPRAGATSRTRQRRLDLPGSSVLSSSPT